jgi:nucleotide-binding universal stress UspA family protein
MKIKMPTSTGGSDIITLNNVDVTCTVREGLEKSILSKINETTIGGAVLKSLAKTWNSDNDKIRIDDFLGLDKKLLELTKPLEIDKKNLGYNSEASNARRTIRVVKWLASKTTEEKETKTSKRRGSIDPSDPDFQPQPSRRRSRESVIYAGVVPSVDDHEEDVELPSFNDYKKPNNIHEPIKYLVCVDGSEVSHTAFQATKNLMTRKMGDKIEVLHICDRTKSYLPFDLQPDYIKMTYEMELLSIPKEQQTITTLNKTDERLTNGITTVLTAKDLICKYANDPTFPDGIDKVPTHDVPDLLVLGIVGRKGPKMSPKIFGSASDYSMRKARCSSLIIKTNIPSRGTSGMKPRIFVVAVDGSQSSHEALLKTIQLCDRNRDVVNVVHFFDGRVTNNDLNAKDPNDLKTYYQNVMNDANVIRGTVVVVEKQIGVTYGESIVAFAFDNGCHILSLGTDGMTAFCTGKQVDNEGGKFGSTSDYCVKNAKCNVMVSKVVNGVW